jgi:hypothetical protein
MIGVLVRLTFAFRTGLRLELLLQFRLSRGLPCRFSLRTLLIGMTMVAVLLGVILLGIERNLRAAKRDNHPLMRPLKIEATTDATHPDYNNAVSSHIRTTCNLPVRKEEF